MGKNMMLFLWENEDRERYCLSMQYIKNIHRGENHEKIIYLLILLSLFAVGCGKDNTITDNQTENTQDEDNNGNSDENDTSNGEGTTTEEDDTTKVEEIPFDLQMELPEGTTVGEFISSATIEGTIGWLLENPNYATQREYAQFQDELLWTKTACGWIEKHKNDGEIMPDGTPVYKSNHCTNQKNGYWIDSGYF